MQKADPLTGLAAFHASKSASRYILGDPGSSTPVTPCDSTVEALSDYQLSLQRPAPAAALDSTTISRAKLGDIDAFTAIVEAYHPRCLRFARAMLRNPDDAEDMVQEAFVRLYRALPRYEERQRFESWLFQILGNCCRTANTAFRRHDARTVDDEVLDASARRRTRPAHAFDNEWGDDVRRALADVPDYNREIFLLHYIEGFAYDEIERMTGIKQSALKMRVKRASDMLRARLRREVWMSNDATTIRCSIARSTSCAGFLRWTRVAIRRIVDRRRRSARLSPPTSRCSSNELSGQIDSHLERDRPCRRGGHRRIRRSRRGGDESADADGCCHAAAPATATANRSARWRRARRSRVRFYSNSYSRTLMPARVGRRRFQQMESDASPMTRSPDDATWSVIIPIVPGSPHLWIHGRRLGLHARSARAEGARRRSRDRGSVVIVGRP